LDGLARDACFSIEALSSGGDNTVGADHVFTIDVQPFTVLRALMFIIAAGTRLAFGDRRLRTSGVNMLSIRIVLRCGKTYATSTEMTRSDVYQKTTT
jgi:hypothetical protein